MRELATNDGSTRKAGDIANLGEPILLKNLNLAGISAEAALPGQKVRLWTSMALTSDQDLFQKVIGNIADTIEHAARAVGEYTSLNRAQTVLLVLHPDNSGELWVDSAAMCTYHSLKRPGPMAAGTVLFENDIADVRGLWFPLVDVGPEDRILCIIREGWRFALYFDFNPDGDLEVEKAKRALGTLFRQMRYADRYASIAHEPTFKSMVVAGWFPFLELGDGEIGTLLATIKADLPLDRSEKDLISAFNDTRLERVFSRWMERAHLKERETILRPAINAFKNSEPVTVIKIILSEIEGVMSDTYYEIHGERPYRSNRLPDFMIELAERRAGGKDTLFFPVEFGKYLKEYTYADFSPNDEGKAGSRHAVSHGRVAGNQYTMSRALQALLTLDQIAFYM
ncbi:hypothetical protein CEW89_08750 [Celeribacter ethanolicus]|uniref:Uncharacterized protein n=2 Tax=Celeribacter ethanolicus TaxID=1758178 RepID=A0A291GC75_9RHOB|nr:hypothetical protein CEW89_08750 [Celeribacter ethanolicus]